MTAPVYPADAACAGHPHPEWWDGRRDGEPAEQRVRRQQAAARICRTCPVAEACRAAHTTGDGVRAGRWNGRPILRDETEAIPLPDVQPRPDARDVLLTRRQTDVLACLAHGLGPAQTCHRLGISNWTLRSHVKAILAALNVRDRAQAVQLVWSGAVTIGRRPPAHGRRAS